MNDPNTTDEPDGSGQIKVGERRPIASRNSGWAQQITVLLAKCGISPNAISVAGMFFGAFAGACFAGSAHTEGLAARALLIGAATGIQFRLLCNLFDGMVAVHAQRFSPSGEMYNEVPDRVSDAAILIGAGYAVGSMPELGYTAAVVAVFVAYVRAMGKIVAGKQDFRGPMAKPQRMALMTLAAVYVALTPYAWQPQLGERGLGMIGLALVVIVIGGLWTAWRRLSSASAACVTSAKEASMSTPPPNSPPPASNSTSASEEGSSPP